MNKAMFERDILYPTDKPHEPGCIHVSVYPPEQMGGIPLIIEPKTSHNPLDYIADILVILQADIFDRIRIDIKSCGIIYFKGENNNYRLKFSDKVSYTVEEVPHLICG